MTIDGSGQQEKFGEEDGRNHFSINGPLPCELHL